MFIAVLVILFMGKGQMTETVRYIWPLGIAIILSLGVMNTVYMLNRKLLALLENEDWPALTAYLEKKIYEEGMYKPRYVKLLIQSCLATGNFDGAVNIKNRLTAVKPSLVEDNALILGTAYLLGGDSAGKAAGIATGAAAGIPAAAAVEFLRERLEKGQSEEMDWLRWYYGFSLILTGAYEQAGTVMGELAADVPSAHLPLANARDILVTGLAAFVLTELTRKSPTAPAEWRIKAEEGKSRVRKTLKTAGRWARKAEKLKTEIHGAVIKNYVDKTGAWIWRNN